MARTQGHGNPRWERDEIILALELYFDRQERLPGPRDPAVNSLSNLLRSLPYHSEAVKNATFRNSQGVAFKLQNLRKVATGIGLGNVSRTDRLIWEEFGSRPEEVRRLAASIKSTIGSSNADSTEPDFEFLEGRMLTRQHVIRERSRSIRRELLKSRTLKCEVCDGEYLHLPNDLRQSLFEAHHIIPVSEAGERATKLSDMALLCACCHRLIHAAAVTQRRWVAIEEARSLFAYRSSSTKII